MDRSRGRATRSRHWEHAAARGGITAATLAFTRGVSGVNIHGAETSDQLFTARFHDRRPAVTLADGTLEVRYRAGLKPTKGEVELSPAVAWAIEICGGAARLDADLTRVTLASITIFGGASHVTLRLPEARARIPIRIAGGAKQVAILRPAGVGAELHIGKGAAHLTVDEQRFGALGGDIRLESSPGHPSSARYDIDVRSGANHMTVGMAQLRNRSDRSSQR